MIRYAICKLGQIPVRFSPSERVEMSNQLLFGEQLEILEEQGQWLLVRSLHDNYEGWISANFFSDFLDFKRDKPQLPQNVITSLTAQVVFGGQSRLIGFGSSTSPTDKITEGTQTDLNLSDQTGQNNKENLLPYAFQLLGTPYLWGGRSVFGMDCSGFIQLIYKAIGIALPRDASQQANRGTPISFIEEAQAGDLAFFDNEDGKITHVALFTDSKNVIHASGFVRKDPIDHYGIYNPTLGKYSHKLRIIKRI